MVVALVLAGGVGSRVGAPVPKQFVEVCGRPVLAYTIAIFQNHPEVDLIAVVHHPDYGRRVEEIVSEGGFSKAEVFAQGGDTFQDSVINGIAALEGRVGADDILLVQYGASPMTPDAVVSDAIRVCREKGNASPARSLVYLAAHSADGEGSVEWVDRDSVMCLNTPQALRFGYALDLYRRAGEAGVLDRVDPHTTSLMMALGDEVFFSYDESSNLKITTPADLRLFEAWVAGGGMAHWGCDAF